jgi:hypothetical protein
MASQCERVSSGRKRRIRTRTMIPHILRSGCVVSVSGRRLWEIFLGVLLTVVVGAGSVPAAVEHGVREHALANGLKTLLVEDHWHPLVALEVCYRVGARDDPAGKQGMMAEMRQRREQIEKMHQEMTQELQKQMTARSVTIRKRWKG